MNKEEGRTLRANNRPRGLVLRGSIREDTRGRLACRSYRPGYSASASEKTARLAAKGIAFYERYKSIHTRRASSRLLPIANDRGRTTDLDGGFYERASMVLGCLDHLQIECSPHRIAKQPRATNRPDGALRISGRITYRDYWPLSRSRDMDTQRDILFKMYGHT